MLKARIFVSAVTSEFGSLRKMVAEILLRLGYDPEVQDIFGTEPGDLRQMLREKIDDCEGLIQIVGHGYGAEPPTIDPEYGRVSYTQFEFLYAQKQGKKTWLLMAGDGCARDTPLEKQDLPLDPQHPDPLGRQRECRELQDAYCKKLGASGHLRHSAGSTEALALSVERMRNDFAELRQRFRAWQGWVGRSLAAIVVLLAGIACLVAWNVWVQGTPKPAPAAKEPGELTLAINLAPDTPRDEDPAFQAVPDDRRLHYVENPSGEALDVTYRMPYLLQHAQGGPIRGVTMPPFAWTYPRLSIKAVNNQSGTVMLGELQVEVLESRRLDDPILLVESDTYNTLVLVNEGWSDVLDPVVTFDLRRLDAGDKPPASPGHTVRLPTFSGMAKAPIAAMVPKELEQDDAVEIQGTIAYGPAKERKSLRFTTTVSLQMRSQHAVPPSFTYDVSLKAGEAGVVHRVPVSQAIRAGEADQFLLRVASDRSAHYRFRLTVKSVEGQVVARREVRLAMFVPRSAANVPVIKRDSAAESRTSRNP